MYFTPREENVWNRLPQSAGVDYVSRFKTEAGFTPEKMGEI